MNALIVTINFKGASQTLEFLHSLSLLDLFDRTSVLIVDNASGDGSFGAITNHITHMPNCRCLAAPKNLGYFGAAKWALDIWRSETAVPDWVIVCNNDILFPDSDFLTTLFEQPTDVGIIAPRIVSMRNEYEQNPYMLTRPGKVKLWKMRFWFSKFALLTLKTEISDRLRIARRIFRSNGRKGLFRKHIYAPHGAFVIFSRAFFQQGGVIDDGAFLYAEEIGAAEASAHINLPVVFEPTLKVLHNEHRSTGSKLTPATYSYKREALRYLQEKYWQDIR